MTNKVDDGTIAELRRLTSAPGHDRMGMMAKGCMVNLLDELAELRKFYDDMNKTVMLPPDMPSAPASTKTIWAPKNDEGKSYSTADRNDALASAFDSEPEEFFEGLDEDEEDLK